VIVRKKLRERERGRERVKEVVIENEE